MVNDNLDEVLSELERDYPDEKYNLTEYSLGIRKCLHLERTGSKWPMGQCVRVQCALIPPIRFSHGPTSWIRIHYRTTYNGDIISGCHSPLTAPTIVTHEFNEPKTHDNEPTSMDTAEFHQDTPETQEAGLRWFVTTLSPLNQLWSNYPLVFLSVQKWWSVECTQLWTRETLITHLAW